MLWVAIKAVYSGLISDRQEWELAETFFNSITRKVFTTVGIDSAVELVDTDCDSPPSPSHAPVYRTYDGAASITTLIGEILEDARHGVDYADFAGDVVEVAGCGAPGSAGAGTGISGSTSITRWGFPISMWSSSFPVPSYRRRLLL